MKSVNVSLESPTRVPQFIIRLSGTRRGARLARRLAVQQLASWGVSYDSETSRSVALVTAELASNAIRHGRIPGRDFRLTLLHLAQTFRIEVTDTRPERHPSRPTGDPESPDACSGRGLLLVEAYSGHWGWTARDAYTKTAWADVTFQPSDAPWPLDAEPGSAAAADARTRQA